MGAAFITYTPSGTNGPPASGSGFGAETLAEPDVQRLAETFAVTPEAVRLAVARVGTDFRQVQRELGGRR
ncbi:MAG: DUF3606 domain-containing protein [Caulobacterales bacterium]|nr:DUF3606 domain-containing protein [Caulobacterales bacterium]